MKDLSANDPVGMRRVTAGRIVRTSYATAVAFLGIGLFWLAIKPFIYTQTPGRVIAPQYVVSTPYNARIVAVYVEPGDHVRAGDHLAKVRAPDVMALMSTLGSSVAEQVNVLAELRIRLTVAEASLPSAQQRARISAYNMSRLGMDTCDTRATFCSEVNRENAEAIGIVARLNAEIIELQTQIERVEQARRFVADLRDSVMESFNGGEQISPIDGMIGPTTASEGQSVLPGDVIVSVLDVSRTEIEWVLHDARIRQPQIGDPVYIMDGSHALRGYVANVLSVADEAAGSRSLFEPASNGQVVRVKLQAGEIYPALLTTLEVRYNYWRSLDTLVELYVYGMEALGLWRKG